MFLDIVSTLAVIRLPDAITAAYTVGADEDVIKLISSKLETDQIEKNLCAHDSSDRTLIKKH